MSENENMDFTPPIPAGEGWSQMQLLLDVHMPSAHPKKKPIIYYWLAAALLGLLLAGFPLKETIKPLQNISLQTNDAGAAIVSPVQAALLQAATFDPYKRDIKIANSTPYNAIVGHANTIKEGEVKDSSNTISSHKQDTVDVSTVALADNIFLSETKAATVTDSVPTTIKKPATKKSKWQLYAGASTNIVTSEKTKNFQPYPTAEIRFAPNKHIFISAGLAVMSPVTSSTSAVEKSYLLNDTLNNVKIYNENVVYTRLHYVDVPLTFGVNLTRHLSVSAGMQASVLLFSASYNNAESYDFQMNRMDVQATGLVALPNVDKPDETFAVNTRKVEFRYVAGAEYRFNRLAVDLRYQHALAPAVKSEVTRGHNNSLLSVGLKYRLK